MTSSKMDVNSETSKVAQKKCYPRSGKGGINEVRFPGFLQSQSMQDCLKKWPSFCVIMCELL